MDVVCTSGGCGRWESTILNTKTKWNSLCCIIGFKCIPRESSLSKVTVMDVLKFECNDSNDKSLLYL